MRFIVLLLLGCNIISSQNIHYTKIKNKKDKNYTEAAYQNIKISKNKSAILGYEVSENFGGGIYKICYSPSNCSEDEIIKQINSAHKIRIMVFDITNKNIALAIIKNKHKDIKIITDNRQSRGLNSKIQIIKDEGIKVCINRITRIQHDKIGIFDNIVSVGSYNWTTSASKFNAEDSMFINNVIISGTHEARFNQLWSGYKCDKSVNF